MCVSLFGRRRRRKWGLNWLAVTIQPAMRRWAICGTYRMQQQHLSAVKVFWYDSNLQFTNDSPCLSDDKPDASISSTLRQRINLLGLSCVNTSHVQYKSWTHITWEKCEVSQCDNNGMGSLIVLWRSKFSCASLSYQVFYKIYMQRSLRKYWCYDLQRNVWCSFKHIQLPRH